jgi:hypothetical protein
VLSRRFLNEKGRTVQANDSAAVAYRVKQRLQRTSASAAKIKHMLAGGYADKAWTHCMEARCVPLLPRYHLIWLHQFLRDFPPDQFCNMCHFDKRRSPERKGKLQTNGTPRRCGKQNSDFRLKS